MQTGYAPAVLVKLADMLYKKAGQIVGLCTLVLGFIAGYMIGTARAFMLRVQAQMALCQKQIEENTRS